MAAYDLFQLSKLRKVLSIQGENFKFMYYGKNEFGEYNSSVQSTYDILGLFHTSNKYVSIVVSEAGFMGSKDKPEMMCTWLEGKNVPIDAEVTILSTKYKVNAVTDVGNMHVIANLSLEVME